MSDKFSTNCAQVYATRVFNPEIASFFFLAPDMRLPRVILDIIKLLFCPLYFVF